MKDLRRAMHHTGVGVQLLLRLHPLQRRDGRCDCGRGEAIVLAVVGHRSSVATVAHQALVDAGRAGDIVDALVPRVLDDGRIVALERQAGAGAPFRGDAVPDRRGVPFVLLPGLGVLLLLVALPPLLHAVRHAEAHDDQYWHRYRQDGTQSHLRRAQTIAVRRRRGDLFRGVVGVRGGVVLASVAAEAAGADALVAVDSVHASAAVQARRRAALVDVDAAVLAGESRPALAPVVVVEVRATAAVRARLGEAQVHFAAAIGPDVAGHALAPVLVYHVDARAAVQARAVLAVVDVLLAVRADESRRTRALVVVADAAAHPAVPARIRLALVDLHVAVLAVVPGRASAHHPVGRVAAGAVDAGLLRARHGLLLAVSARPALGALARVLLPKGLVHAHAVVQARLLRTARHFDLAFLAREPGRALAREGPLARVEARAAVLARLVVRAVVQVLVAEQSAPALVADALPLLLARSVHASRVQLALLAQRALPSFLAAATEKKRSVRARRKFSSNF